MVQSFKKFPKDDKAPKRNLSGYFHFGNEMRKKNPEFASMVSSDCMKQISSKWNSMSDGSKKKYEGIAAKDKVRYEKEMEKYKLTKSYQKHQATLEEFKEKKRKFEAKFPKDENRPKKSATGWFLFMGDQRPALLEKGFSCADSCAKIAALWKKMGAAEKKKWENKGAKNKAQYDKDIAAYEKTAKYKKYKAAKDENDAEQARLLSEKKRSDKKRRKREAAGFVYKGSSPMKKTSSPKKKKQKTSSPKKKMKKTSSPKKVSSPIFKKQA